MQQADIDRLLGSPQKKEISLTCLIIACCTRKAPRIRSIIIASRALKIDSKKRVTGEPEVGAGYSEALDKTSIATRAYELWQARGCPVGSDQEDWFNAETELRSIIEED